MAERTDAAYGAAFANYCAYTSHRFESDLAAPMPTRSKLARQYAEGIADAAIAELRRSDRPDSEREGK